MLGWLSSLCQVMLHVGDAALAVPCCYAGAQLKNAIASLLPYGPAIAEHCVLQAQLQAGRVLTKQLLSDQELLSLHKSIQQLESWFASLEQSAPEGFISLAPKAGGNQVVLVLIVLLFISLEHVNR